MIHITLIARSPAIRAGLRAMLEPEIDIIAEVGQLADLPTDDWQESDVLLVDGAVLDAELLVDAVQSEGPAILVLGWTGRRTLGSEAAALGFLSADASAEQLLAAVRALAVGLSVHEPGTPSATQEDLDAPSELTPREREVLQLVAAGLPNKGIAHRLGISDHTVKYHLAAVLSKLGAASRAEAVALAARHGLIAL